MSYKFSESEARNFLKALKTPNRNWQAPKIPIFFQEKRHLNPFFTSFWLEKDLSTLKFALDFNERIIIKILCISKKIATFDQF